MGYTPHPQSQYHPSPPYAAEHQTSPYSAQQLDYPYPSPSSTSSSSSSATHHKPYPQPVPASYTTASTPTGPRFSVQVKTAQPVTTYSQTGRQAEQAYTPPPPRQHASRVPAQDRDRPPYPDHIPPQHQQQGWYAMPPSSGQDMLGEGGYAKGGAEGPMGVRGVQGPQLPKKGPVSSGSVPGPAGQPSKVRALQKHNTYCYNRFEKLLEFPFV